MSTAAESQAVKPRKPRGFKIALIVILFLFLLFAAAIYFLPHFLPVDTIRQIANSKARELAGVDVDFTGLRFNWNGAVVVDNIVVSPLGPDGNPTDPLLTLDEVKTNVDLMSALSGVIIVKNVEVNGFKVDVKRDADGNLNLPDFSKLSAAAPAGAARQGRSRQMLSAVAADTTTPAPAETAAPASAPAPAGDGLPPIEIHKVELLNGVLSYTDAIENLALDAALDFMRIEGSTLNDPFTLTGRLLPFPGDPEKGEIPFSGKVALLKDGAFNPEGEAAIEVGIRHFNVHEMAGRLGLGALVAGGHAEGVVKAALVEKKALMSVADMVVADVALELGDLSVAVPRTSLAFNSEFDPEVGMLKMSDIALTNELAAVKAAGWVEGIYDVAEGGVPVGAIDFSGTTDFARLTGYVEDLHLDIPEIPTIEGSSSFFGKAVLGKPDSPSDPLTPTLTLDFSEGRLAVHEPSSGIAFDTELTGLSLRAAVAIKADPELTSNVTMRNVPLNLTLPQLDNNTVSLVANGGVALTASEANVAMELRLKDSAATLPATPWSTPVTIRNPEARITVDLAAGTVTIPKMDAIINNNIHAGIDNASFTGLTQGNLQGQAVLNLTAALQELANVVKPMVPSGIGPLGGSIRSATSIRLNGSAAEARAMAELDKTDVVLTMADGRAALEAAKTTVGLVAAANLANPTAVTLNSLEVENQGAAVRLVAADGNSVAGRLGNTVAKLEGVVDLAAGVAQFSTFSMGSNGLTAALGQGENQMAGLESGTMQLVAASQDNKLVVPISGAGDFALPSLEFGIDKFVFYRMNQGQRENSDFGNVRAKLGLDGYIGDAKRQIVNLRTAEFVANPVAAQARGQTDLGSGALVAQYAARFAPTAMSSLLGYLQLPPALLTGAAVSGSLSWNGSQLDSKGQVQGQLRLASGEASPFEMVHDFSAAYLEAEKALVVNMRRLDGNVKTASGEAVVTLQAQQSNLLLSRTGVKGLLDIRVNGAAAPTRILALGLLGVFPQFRDYSNILYKSLAEGVYQAWIQVRDKDAGTIGLTMGGIWQGAALRLNDVPYLAEPKQLSAAVEGEVALRENQIRLTKLVLNSSSALAEANGTAVVSLTADQNHDITGLANVGVNLSFILADLSKLSMVFPGVMPADLGLVGRVDGTFKAGGDAANIAVQEGAVRFQNLQARPGGLDFRIPNGTANFGAVFAMNAQQQNLQALGNESVYDIFRHFDIRDGKASLVGAQFMNRPINTMASAFRLEKGVFTLESAQMSIGGEQTGDLAANASVDFNPAVPTVTARFAVRNMPLEELGQELEQYVLLQNGSVNLPAEQGGTAGVAFTGFTEDDILRTVRLDNFTFATGPVRVHAGPVLNQELDRARGLMKMPVAEGSKDREFTFQSITGTVTAAGDGVITIPSERPLNLVGDNTGDFRIQGSVRADHTIDIEAMVAGKIENILGFSLPNIIPNLRQQSDEEKNRFMQRLNKNAANGNYKVRISGPLDSPSLSGIGELAVRMLADITLAAPGSIIGGVLDLGRDAPGAVLSAPKNITQGLGNLLTGGGGGGAADAVGAAGEAGAQSQQPGGGLQLPFLRNRSAAQDAEPAPQTQAEQGAAQHQGLQGLLRQQQTGQEATAQQPAPHRPGTGDAAAQEEEEAVRRPMRPTRRQ